MHFTGIVFDAAPANTQSALLKNKDRGNKKSPDRQYQPGLFALEGQITLSLPAMYAERLRNTTSINRSRRNPSTMRRTHLCGPGVVDQYREQFVGLGIHRGRDYTLRKNCVNSSCEKSELSFCDTRTATRIMLLALRSVQRSCYRAQTHDARHASEQHDSAQRIRCRDRSR